MEYFCSVCSALCFYEEVKNEWVKTCDHQDAVIVAKMSATCRGVGEVS